jgi:hypothetical protein
MFRVKAEAGKAYMVPKEHVHNIIADQGEEYVGFCVHALRHEDGSVVETNMIEDINNGNIEINIPFKD